MLLGPEDYARLGRLSEPERSRDLGRRAWSFVKENPGRYAGLCLQRLRYFLLFDETNPKAANRTYRAATVVWLALAFVGFLMSWRRRRRLWPTYAIFTLVTVFHALVITAVRFRIPLEPMTFIWASLAVSPALARLPARPQIKIYRPVDASRDPFTARHVLQGPHFRTSKEAAKRREAGRRVG